MDVRNLAPLAWPLLLAGAPTSLATLSPAQPWSLSLRLWPLPLCGSQRPGSGPFCHQQALRSHRGHQTSWGLWPSAAHLPAAPAMAVVTPTWWLQPPGPLQLQKLVHLYPHPSGTPPPWWAPMGAPQPPSTCCGFSGANQVSRPGHTPGCPSSAPQRAQELRLLSWGSGTGRGHSCWTQGPPGVPEHLPLGLRVQQSPSLSGAKEMESWPLQCPCPTPGPVRGTGVTADAQQRVPGSSKSGRRPATDAPSERAGPGPSEVPGSGRRWGDLQPPGGQPG